MTCDPIFRCHCGERTPNAPIRLVEEGAKPFAIISLCDKCNAAMKANLERIMPLFGSMREAGVDPDIASETIKHLFFLMNGVTVEAAGFA